MNNMCKTWLQSGRYIPQLLLLGALTACSLTETGSAQKPAELLFYNGTIYTMDADRSTAEAVAVRDGRIVFVGAKTAADKYIGAVTRSVDLKGRMLLPSFQDVHIHPVQGGLAFTGCPLFELPTLDDVMAKLRTCVAEDPDASALVAYGWNWGNFVGNKSPHKNLLDQFDFAGPIVTGDSDGHTLWVNSTALDLAGIDSNTPQPDGGEIGQDENGEPDGILREGPAMDMMLNALPPYTLEQKVAAYHYAQDYLHSIGITAMHDAMVRVGLEDIYATIDTYAAVRDRGELDMRVVAALNWEPGVGLDQVPQLIATREKYSGGRLQATAIKFWADGIVETHTAYMLEPYTDNPDSRGLLMIPMDEIQAGTMALDAAGFQLHIHAIGDGTVRSALDALEQAQATNGVRDSRHLTAHTQLVHPDDVTRFGELGVIAGFSPYWAYNDEYVRLINPAQLGPERMASMYPIKSIGTSGGRIAFGSDWSVTSADPLLGIETAVTRESAHDEEIVPVFIPGERLTLDQAIAGYTIDAAYANFLDQDTGSIEVGKFADLVILSNNLFDIPPAQISDTKVTATLLEGELVYGEL